MSNSTLIMVFLLIYFLTPSWAFPHSDHDSIGSRSRRGATCGKDMYSHNNLCCLNCEAGERLMSPCTSDGEKGQCVECQDGAYMEHPNHEKRCFQCDECRPDQKIVRHCSPTQNTECECKAGRFCAHDQACEVCKKCAKCEKDEVIVRNCTSTTNTECKKIKSKSSSASGNSSMLWLLMIPSLIVTVLAVTGVYWWKNQRASDSQSSRPDWLKSAEASFPKLVPVNGEESLRRSFEYFAEVDIDYQKRFFRHLGISDNMIRSKENLPYEDRMHELLTIWVEQTGKQASLNDLLNALLSLNQRLTAETIKQRAIEDNHYTECDNELSEQFSGNI